MSTKNTLNSVENMLVLISGASRGIGRELAIHLAKKYPDKKMHLFLVARGKDGLEETKKQVEKCSPLARVETVVADLSEQPFAEANFAMILQTLKEENRFDFCLIVHNAGTLGDLTRKSSELVDEAQWHAYLQTNLVSTILLNNLVFAELGNDNDKAKKVFLVNITSLLSVKAYPSFTQYSIGKAAREAYFRAFATEHPKCRVLNYSPGPVDTDMHVEVCQKTYDAGVRQVFSTQRHDITLHRKLLAPEETVQRLVSLLEEDKFENGARVDYFDK